MWISGCFSCVDYTLLCWRLILNKIKAWWKILISFDDKKFGSPDGPPRRTSHSPGRFIGRLGRPVILHTDKNGPITCMRYYRLPHDQLYGFCCFSPRHAMCFTEYMTCSKVCLVTKLVSLVARNILWLPYTFKISVFNFSSSPIANAMKNSSGLWDLEVLWPTWLLKLIGSIDIIELDNYCHSKIKSGYRSSNSNSPNGSPWKYLKSYTGIFTPNAYHQSKMWNKWDTKSHILFLYLIVCHAREDHWTICPLCHQAEKETHHEVSQSPGGESNSGTFITDKQRTVWDKMYLQ